MTRPMHPLLAVLAVLAVLPLAGCDPSRAPPPRAADDGPRVLARVGGVPITERDLEHRVRRPGMGTGHAAEPSGEVLQTVILDEVVRQQALALGLDRDPGYRRRLDDLAAQVRTFERQELGGRLRAWAQERATVDEAEARDFFEQNAPLLRARYHVYQIFYRGHLAELLAAHADVRAGTPFEEVAARRFAGAPREGGRAPWDLGELGWYQLPPAWRGVVDRLQPGEITDVIRGDGERAWVVKLAGKRLDPAVTLETERERITALLRQRKAEALLATTIAKARDRAVIALEPERLARVARPANAP